MAYGEWRGGLFLTLILCEMKLKSWSVLVLLFWQVVFCLFLGSAKDLICTHFTDGMTELAIAYILQGVLKALDYIHHMGYVHRCWKMHCSFSFWWEFLGTILTVEQRLNQESQNAGSFVFAVRANQSDTHGRWHHWSSWAAWKCPCGADLPHRPLCIKSQSMTFSPAFPCHRNILWELAKGMNRILLIDFCPAPKMLGVSACWQGADQVLFYALSCLVKQGTWLFSLSPGVLKPAISWSLWMARFTCLACAVTWAWSTTGSDSKLFMTSPNTASKCCLGSALRFCSRCV